MAINVNFRLKNKYDMSILHVGILVCACRTTVWTKATLWFSFDQFYWFKLVKFGKVVVCIECCCHDNLGVGEDFVEQYVVSSIRWQMTSSGRRLSSMMHMLQERAHDLEVREGNAAVLLDTANELLEWVEQEMEQEVLAQPPPGELDQLKSNSTSLMVSW